ncbi:MAG: LAGLIDADG family homing endonuclease [Paraclostridium sp.]
MKDNVITKESIEKYIIVDMENIRSVGEVNKHVDEFAKTDLAKRILFDKYVRTKAGESFDGWLDRVSAGNTELRNRILNHEFIFGGRILATRGVTDVKATYSNCYVVKSPEDNVKDIFRAANDMAQTFSRGGGCGVNLSKLRPSGAKVNNASNSTTGPVSFMEIYDKTTGIINQDGRRGALMISLDVSHPDADKFIKAKNEYDSLKNCNISLAVDNEFMIAAAKGLPYTQKFTCEDGSVIEKTIDAKALFMEIAKLNHEGAEPGLLYWDTVKENHILSNDPDFKYDGVNPCVTGDTPILTDRGYVNISSVVNQPINVWNGYEYSNVTPEITGTNQEIFKIKFSNGRTLKCTPYHKFILNDNRRVMAKDLFIGDKLVKCDFPVIEGEKQLENVIYDNTFVPDVSYSIESRLQWLAGIIDADGSCDKYGELQISSVDETFMLNIQLMLQTLGVQSSVSVINGYCKISIPSSNSMKLVDLGLKCHRVIINSTPNRDATRFITVSSIELQEHLEPVVYCFTEEKNHSGIFNGVITAQCGEEPLPAGGACLLGSVNLASCIIKDADGVNKINVAKFVTLVQEGVVYLNEVLDEGINLHALEEQSKMAAEYRQIGLSTIGISTALIKLGIRYGSPEAVILSSTLSRIMANAALKASALLAKEYGTYPKYNSDLVLTSKYITNCANEQTIDLIKRYGLRNSQLLTIPPSGSISNLMSISGGIEPYYAFSYTRKTESLGGKDEYHQVHEVILQDYLNNNPGDDKLPEYFIASEQIPPLERIAMQSAWQSHIDAAISSTINLPNHATVEQVAGIYMESWLQGLKGVTIYRDGCNRSAILTTEKPKEEEQISPTIDCTELKRGEVAPISPDTVYIPKDIHIGCGKIKLHVGYSPMKKTIQDFYVIKSGQGGCEHNLHGVAIYMSQVMRMGGNVASMEKAINGIGSCASFALQRGKGKHLSQGTTCPSAILKAVKEIENAINSVSQTPNVIGENVEDMTAKDITVSNHHVNDGSRCPECGNKLEFAGGCNSCNSCGYSYCG